MKHYLYCSIVAFLLFSCNSKQLESQLKSEQHILTATDSITRELTIITQASGDLDHDGIDERAVIYETQEKTEYGNVRELQLQKKKTISGSSGILLQMLF